MTINAIPSAPAAPVASVTAQPTCAIESGTIEFTAQADVEYSIDGGSTYQPGVSFANLIPGDYDLAVRSTVDGTCETVSGSLTINAIPTAPAAPVASVTAQPTCAIQSGTIVFTAQSDVEYSIDGGTTYQADVSFATLIPGDYDLAVRSTVDGTCETISGSLTINAIPLAPAAPVASVTVQPTCAVPTGTIVFTTQSDVLYSINGVDFQASETFAGLIPNDYTLTVRSTVDGTCETLGATLTVAPVPSAPIIVDVDPENPTLIACPALDNGSIVITATGSNLEYSIDNGVNFQTSNTFANLDADSYEIVVRDNVTGCATVNSNPIVLTAPTCVADYTVSITQDSGPASVNAIGQTLGYTIQFTNIGTLDVTGINIVNTQPDGTLGTLVGPTGDAGTPGVLDIGETWTYTVTYTTSLVDFQNAIDLVNTISITSTEVTSPEEDTAITPIIVSDLSLNASVNNASPVVGSDVILTIEVENDGPSDVTGIEVTDLLPSGYTYVSDDAGTYDAVTGLWTIGGISNGSSAVINITATVNATGDYTNVAEVTAADNLDPDSTVNNNDINEDDQDSISLTPEASSDISFTMDIDNDTPNIGDSVVFTLTVNNNGPSDATGVEVTDLLPSGYTFVSDDGSGSL